MFIGKIETFISTAIILTISKFIYSVTMTSSMQSVPVLATRFPCFYKEFGFWFLILFLQFPVRGTIVQKSDKWLNGNQMWKITCDNKLENERFVSLRQNTFGKVSICTTTYEII